MAERGWTKQDIEDAISRGRTGTSVDQRSPGKTPDGIARNDPASVYGERGNYAVVNDRTGEVTQVSNRNAAGWIDDSRINWND